MRAYAALRQINAHEFFSSRYSVCFGLSSSVWQSVWQRVSVYKEIQEARLRHFTLYKKHVWLTGPYKMSVNELSIFDDENAQLALW